MEFQPQSELMNRNVVQIEQRFLIFFHPRLILPRPLHILTSFQNVTT
jgi:hypothetical protein